MNLEICEKSGRWRDGEGRRRGTTDINTQASTYADKESASHGKGSYAPEHAVVFHAWRCSVFNLLVPVVEKAEKKALDSGFLPIDQSINGLSTSRFSYELFEFCRLSNGILSFVSPSPGSRTRADHRPR
jgi:hypothetical protein